MKVYQVYQDYQVYQVYQNEKTLVWTHDKPHMHIVRIISQTSQWSVGRQGVWIT